MAIRFLITLISGAVVFVLASVVLAQAVQTVVFTFVNGGSPVNNVTLFVYFPDKVRPVSLTSKMVWNATNKALSVAINEIKAYERVSIEIMVTGVPGDYELKGQLIGQWTQVAQNFQSDLIPVKTSIRKIGESVTIVETIRSNPKVVAATKNVVVPAAVALEAASAGALVSSAAAANASLAANIAEALRFFQFISLGLFRWRRSKPWGRVFNQLTTRPIKGVTVRVFEATFQKLKDTQFTDKDGRFGFLVSPGTYYLVFSKNGFQETKTDLITVRDGGEALDIGVPMLPESGLTLRAKTFFKFMTSVMKIINKINPIILTIGTLVGLGIVIILPTVFNFVVFGVYLVLDVFKIIISKRVLKSFGQVVDKATRQPLALAVVRIFDADKNWLLTSRVSDSDGHFKFLVSPGNYYITGVKEGYKSFISPVLSISKASVVNWDITLERAA